MRAFVGLPLPEPWIDPLLRAQSRLPGGRPVPEDDLHLTLAFLDDQTEDKLEALHDLLDARRDKAAVLEPLAFAVFGAGRARLVALDLRATPDLSALRDGVRNAVRRAGIDLPRERFRPHVTLLRYPASAPPEGDRLMRALTGLGAPAITPAPAPAVAMWTSRLTPSGPIYDQVATYPLVAA